MLSVARLIFSMFHGHSVLAGSTGFEDSAAVRNLALIAVSSIGFAFEASSIVLYAIALFTTARMMSERIGRVHGERPSAGRAIVALSIRGLLVACVLGTANALILWAVMNTKWHALTTWWVFSNAISAVTMSVFAYVMVPPALRLLANSAESLDEHSIRLGRKCAIAAVIASVGLIILEHLIIGIIYGRHAEIVTIRAITSVIAALPYAPLYIALSLLARGERAVVSEENTALLV